MTAIEEMGPIYKLLHTISFPRYVLHISKHICFAYIINLFLNINVLYLLLAMVEYYTLPWVWVMGNTLQSAIIGFINTPMNPFFLHNIHLGLYFDILED